MAKKFIDWFEQNLEVGAFPYLQNTLFNPSLYNIIINVSDEWYNSVHRDLKLIKELSIFWFPMNEVKRDIGLNSIYGAMNILYSAEMNNQRVYLHCHAGVNRSQIVRAAYYYMRTGEQLEEGRSGFINMLCASCLRGYLPPKAEMEQFLTKLGEELKHKKDGLFGGKLDSLKLDTINNF